MSPAKRARPRVREFLGDSLTPVAAYRRLSAQHPRFLFESVTGGEQVSRYSFLGGRPSELYRVYADRLEIDRPGPAGRGDTEVLVGDALGRLRRAIGGFVAEPAEIPFLGGFVGYFGYDIVRLHETLGPRARDAEAPNAKTSGSKLPDLRPPDPFGLPLAMLARIDSLLVFDHARQRLLAVANEIEGEVDADAATAELDRLEALVTGVEGVGAEPLPTAVDGSAARVAVSLEGAEYQAAVRAAQSHIRRGDIFQVVLARRFELGEAPAPTTLYRALRTVNPSPYMVLFEALDLALVGASPEMLVRKNGRRIETRPIAGTRGRGATPAADEALADELLADAKERAEHVMLVDLSRNDLGRVAVPGSVRVPRFMEIERYSHVMHISSRVEAELAPDKDALDLLLACFPAGTVSGAPKVRAMELIDALEPEGRGPYAGAIGYLSFAGDLDTCISIRTLVVQGDQVSVTAGAGIVADSDPAAEQAETESKAAALLAAVDLARALES